MKRTLVLLTLIGQYAFADGVSSCRYLPTTELKPIRKETCIEFQEWERKPNNSDALVTKEVTMSARYNSDNIAYLRSEHGPFYFLKSGKARRTIYYDNGPDYFQEGLARTSWNGKMGFFNKQLDIVISPAYDFAFPFINGISMVCNGCTLEPDGEHRAVLGGHWGFINKAGNVIVPVKFTKSAAIKALNEASKGAP